MIVIVVVLVGGIVVVLVIVVVVDVSGRHCCGRGRGEERGGPPDGPYQQGTTRNSSRG